MTRLAQADARIELLQEQLNRSGRSASHIQSQTDVDFNDSRILDLHTAAGHKVLQYWPRLRVKLTIPDIEIFTFLRVTDRQDIHLMGSLAGGPRTHQCEISTMISFIEKLYEHVTNLPVALMDLLNASSCFSRGHILTPLYDARDALEATIDLQLSALDRFTEERCPC